MGSHVWLSKNLILFFFFWYWVGALNPIPVLSPFWGEENPYKMVAAKGLLKELPLKVQNVYKNTLEHLDPQFTNYQFKFIIKQLMCEI